ncbi:MAG: lia operon protein LiaG [Ancylomarina sp.]|jgi:lia operon protein LiaG
MKARKMNMKYLIVLVGILLMPFYSNAQTIYAEADAKFDGIKRVEIEGRFVDVNILGTDADEVDLKGIIRGKLRGGKDFEFKHRQEGSLLKIWLEGPRSIMGRFEAKLTLKVPYSMNIDIRNSSGDIDIEEIVADKMKLVTTSGDVKLKNIETQLTTSATSGDLDIDYLKGAISAGSTSGDQELSHIRANVSTRATSGDFIFSDIIGDLSTKTTSGDLQYENIDGRISNVSTSGNLTINNAKTVLNLTTTSGDISGNGIELIEDSKFKSTSGDISIDFSNNINAMSFDLKASSGDLRAGSRSADRKLYMKNGDVWIYGVSSSGNQSYR